MADVEDDATPLRVFQLPGEVCEHRSFHVDDAGLRTDSVQRVEVRAHLLALRDHHEHLGLVTCQPHLLVRADRILEREGDLLVDLEIDGLRHASAAAEGEAQMPLRHPRGGKRPHHTLERELAFCQKGLDGGLNLVARGRAWEHLLLEADELHAAQVRA